MSSEIRGEVVFDCTAIEFRDPGSKIAEFVKSDSVLYMYYLLQSDEVDGYDSYCQFLLWFVLIGRRRYRRPLVIPEWVREILAFPNADGRHQLMDFTVRLCFGDTVSDDEVRARYYFNALSKFGLAPFISRAEMRHFTSLEELARQADVNSWSESDPLSAK